MPLLASLQSPILLGVWSQQGKYRTNMVLIEFKCTLKVQFSHYYRPTAVTTAQNRPKRAGQCRMLLARRSSER